MIESSIIPMGYFAKKLSRYFRKGHGSSRGGRVGVELSAEGTVLVDQCSI